MPAVSRARVLVVEPKPATLRSYSLGLAKAGFEVTQASKAQEALREIEKQLFDVVVTDFQLPEMDGLELVRRLSEERAGLQSVLLLETIDNKLSLEARESGVFESLVKPIRPQILEKTVDLALRLRHDRPKVRFERPTFPIKRPHGAFVSFHASDAKKKFAGMLEKAIRGERVLISKHGSPKAVLISVEEFEVLSRAPEMKLEGLRGEFDALLSRMQTPEARKAMEAAFHASPARIGKAAVAAAARKRA